MREKIGFIKEINYNSVTIKIHSENFNSSSGFISSTITLNTILYSELDSKNYICFKVMKIKQLKKQTFKNMEWKDNDVELKCNYLGNFQNEDLFLKKS